MPSIAITRSCRRIVSKVESGLLIILVMTLPIIATFSFYMLWPALPKMLPFFTRSAQSFVLQFCWI
uniref:Predicted protein n=1 Tax=Hordeum vulgare subsp. vulgare TaxID=112509 RepID=F2E061_HORVV|nr:predicted protein [Hordeum vulgare subsp. vulgare]